MVDFNNDDILTLTSILDEIIAVVNNPDIDISWTHYNSKKQLIDDLTDHVKRLQSRDFSRIEDLILLFAPTGSLQEISLNNGWGDKFLTLADKFDDVIK